MPVDLAAVHSALATVKDPEIHQPITDLGMVKSVDADSAGHVSVEVYLTVAGCPMRDRITTDVTNAVVAVPGVTDVSGARSRSPGPIRSPASSPWRRAREASASRR